MAPESSDSLSLVNDEISGRLARLRTSTEHIESKITFLIGLVGAGAQFLATQKGPGSWKAAAFTLYGLALVFGLLGIFVRTYKDVPDPKPFAGRYGGCSANETLGALIGTKADSYEFNNRVLDSKVNYWRLCVGMLVPALVGPSPPSRLDHPSE